MESSNSKRQASRNESVPSFPNLIDWSFTGAWMLEFGALEKLARYVSD
jgi:hypothetical protein